MTVFFAGQRVNLFKKVFVAVFKKRGGLSYISDPDNLLFEAEGQIPMLRHLELSDLGFSFHSYGELVAASKLGA